VDWDKVLTNELQGMREEYNARNPTTEIPPKCTTTWYTTYQEMRSPKPGTPILPLPEILGELRTIRDQQLNDKANFFHISNPTPEEEQYVPYFPHYDQDNVNKLWEIYKNQGQKNTYWISAVASFESVLQIYQYGKMLFSEKFSDIDPSSKIAVIGAGPSGLLWSWYFLVDFPNVTVFEKTDRIGGKTNTLHKRALYGKEVVIELGTCYLSTGYDDLYDLLTDVLLDNRRIGLGKQIEDVPLWDVIIRYIITKYNEFPQKEWRLFADKPKGDIIAQLFNLLEYLCWYKKKSWIYSSF